MTKPIPNDLSYMSDEDFNALCPQGHHAPGPEPLSPAAQAVMDAYVSEDRAGRLAVAAALRAVADQVVPETTTPWNSTLTLIMSTSEARAKLLAIATELEA